MNLLLLYTTLHHEKRGFKIMTDLENTIISSMMRCCESNTENINPVYALIFEYYYHFLIEKRAFLRNSIFKCEYTKFVLHDIQNLKIHIHNMANAHSEKYDIKMIVSEFLKQQYFTYRPKKLKKAINDIFYASIESGNRYLIKDESFESMLEKYNLTVYQDIKSVKAFYRLYLLNNGIKNIKYNKNILKHNLNSVVKYINMNTIQKKVYYAKVITTILNRPLIERCVYEFLIHLRFIKNYEENSDIDRNTFIFAINRCIHLINLIIY